MNLIDQREELVKKACSLADSIFHDHTELATSNLKHDHSLDRLIVYYVSQRNELEQFIRASEQRRLIIGGATKDELVSIGERLSGMFITSLLEQKVGYLSQF